MQRWTPQQARRHPFITGEKFTKRWQVCSSSGVDRRELTSFQPYSPADIPAPTPALTPSSTDSRRPYGGLVQTQSKGSRAYQDAAAYSQQLNQHQTYTAQQQASSQVYRNPYVAPQGGPQQTPPQSAMDYGAPQQQVARQQQTAFGSPMQITPGSQQAPNSSLNMSGSGHAYSQQASAQMAVPANPNPPSSSYYPNARTRASTINQMDAVPPALARLTQMNKDLSGIGRNTLTPVINRDDAMREWERRQAGKAQPAQSYPQLEYLQQQAEMQGSGNWQAGSSSGNRYVPPPSSLMQYQSPVQLLVDNQDRRRERGRQDQPQYTSLPAPPQNTYPGNEGNLGNIYMPMQPSQYNSPSTSSQQAQQQQQQQQSLYGGGVVSAGQAPNAAYSQQRPAGYPTPQSNTQRDVRRASALGSESWRQ
jgi:dual specificity protein kinase YAK1